MRELNTCLLARFAGTSPPGWLRRWLDEGLGGVLLSGPNITGPEQLRTLTAELRAHNPAVLVAADEEGGIVTRLEARTGSSYPGNDALGAVDDTALTRRVAASIGGMLAAGRVSLDFAPVADVRSNPANPIIGVRSFGPDPALVARHTAAFVAGIQASQVAACAKHFPGHGRATADSHVALPVVDAPLAELERCELAPFRAAIESGVQTVMTAHVVFTTLDDAPATLSSRVLTGLLRGELGFRDVIVTDALGMAAIGDDATSSAGAVRSLAAGADLLCLAEGEAAQLRARDALARAVAEGTIPGARVEEAAARVRALADWAAMQGAAMPEPAAGAEAARAALLVRAGGLPLGGPPYVLDAGGRMSGLLDDAAASLLGVLRGRDGRVDGVRLAEPRDSDGRPAVRPAADDHGGDLRPGAQPALDALIDLAAGRPLVLAVQDAHRRPWQRDLIGQVLARRPDTVVVGTGTADDADLADRRYLGARGSGRANLEAAADALLGSGTAR